MKKNQMSIKQLKYTPSCGGIERSELKTLLWTKNLLINLVAKYFATN